MEYKYHPVRSLGPSLTIEQIEEFEKKLRRPLPQEYREFLLMYNGGYLSEKMDTFRSPNSAAWLILFFGINCEKKGIDGSFELELFQTKKPPYSYLFPIGEDIGGNMVCISLGDEDYGKIYGWDHEYGEEEEDWPEALIYCCDSFHEFMETLVLVED